ncbi:MAG: tRNA (adenosine(37)-N6)-threonylcarbamoyltransferase complex dimerization subunit type 1 TsaB [Candidatus Gracilibacteria bacterium]
MLLLCLNTASKQSAIALIENNRVLAENEWVSAANESEKVLPGLEQVLADSGKTWDDLTHMVVVEGPGGYTSLRVGITIANAIAWVKKIPMFNVNVFEIWENRLSKKAQKEPHAIAIAAGRDQWLVKGKIMTLEELKTLEMPCYGEVPEDISGNANANPHAVEMASFGEALIQIDFQNRSTVKSVQPVYTRPPLITKKGS